MPNTPAQVPHIDMPGAEYFSLAPNGTMALQGRKRRIANAILTVPAASSGQVFVPINPIETLFVPGAGVFVHKFVMYVFPGDQSQELQITATQAGLSLDGMVTDAYPLGQPLLTQLSPGAGIVALTDRDMLVPQRDVAIFTTTPSTTLSVQTSLFAKNNDSTNSHQFNVVVAFIWTRVDGLTE